MKVVKADSVAIIYPFLSQDSEFTFSGADSLIIRSDGSIQVFLDRPAVSADEAEQLAKALLHAAKLVQARQKET